jgi:alkylation response protein AidB-like acyl-CoA dehydrogenase
MYVDLSPEERAFRDQVRVYLARLITPEVVAEVRSGPGGGGPLYHRVLQQMGRDGWLGIAWPKAYGGLERTTIEQYVFFDEVQRSGFALPFLTLNTVGPTIARFGSDAQKQDFLPRILAGTCHFSIGYTEPNAGTDLASLETRAEREGEFFVVNGQKLFTSLASYADYIWLAVRSDRNAAKHRGISILIVDARSKGVTITPIHTLGGHPTYATFYEDVRVHESMMVGELHQGWKLITSQLNYERIALSSFGHIARDFESTCDWARDTKLADGARVIDQPWVQLNLAKAYSYLESMKLHCWRQAWNIGREHIDPAEASAVKVYSTESAMLIYKLLLEVVGAPGSLRRGSADAALQGALESGYRSVLVLTFGGGTNEVQRDIIAQAGLGLPRRAP